MANLLPDDINNLNEIDSISNYDEFIMKYESLDKAIQAKMIGSEVDHELIKKLNKLKTNIEEEFKESKRDSNDIQIFNEKWQKLLFKPLLSSPMDDLSAFFLTFIPNFL